MQVLCEPLPLCALGGIGVVTFGIGVSETNRNGPGRSGLPLSLGSTRSAAGAAEAVRRHHDGAPQLALSVIL